MEKKNTVEVTVKFITIMQKFSHQKKIVMSLPPEPEKKAFGYSFAVNTGSLLWRKKSLLKTGMKLLLFLSAAVVKARSQSSKALIL